MSNLWPGRGKDRGVSAKAKKPDEDSDASQQSPGNPSEVCPWSVQALNSSPYPISAHSPNLLLPRWGHSLTVTSVDDLVVFGGTVSDRPTNDIYVISVRDRRVSFVEASGIDPGRVPSPRSGHSAVKMDDKLIVWGGRMSNGNTEDKDRCIWTLDLSSKKWETIRLSLLKCPRTRYGHSTILVGSKLFVFGGRTTRGDTYLNDLWMIDLASQGISRWSELPGDQVDPPQYTEVAVALPTAHQTRPTPRAGHSIVSFEDKLYVFGGTDWLLHYRDVWEYDTLKQTWREVTTSGYLPASREGHTSALVDDIMYIFGGRAPSGRELGDGGAFKISTSCWFTLVNMGPEPSRRAEHAMVSIGKQLFVLGGRCHESFGSFDPTRELSMHALNTNCIKYPPYNVGHRDLHSSWK